MNFESTRCYTIGDYEFPSVTTVISATTPKFWLGIWQRKMAIQYMRDEIIKGDKNLLNEIILDSIATDAFAYPDKFRDEAGDRGTRLHEQIENFAKGETVEVDKDIEIPFNKFLEWYETYNIGILFAEEKVWHDRHGYAGTPDWIHNLRKPNQKKNRIYVTDFKISPRIYKDHQLQVAAYAYAAQQTYGVNIDGAMIVALGHEKSPKYKELTKGELRHLQNIFLSKLHTYYLENKGKFKSIR